MILEIESETGGKWSADFDLNLDFKWIVYNDQDVTKRICGTKAEQILWNAFDYRWELEEFQADYLYEMRHRVESENHYF